MANNIAWQPTQFQNINVDPTRGLAIANAAAKSMSDTIAKQQEAESLAEYRGSTLDIARQKQAHLEGEEARNIAAEKRAIANARAEDAHNLKLANEQGLLISDIVASSGGSNYDKVMQDPKLLDDPRFKKMFGGRLNTQDPILQNIQADFKKQAIAQNKRLFSDPTVYHNTVYKKLLESKKFGREDAAAIATEETTKLFPTLDKEFALKMMMQPGKATYNMMGGSSGGGSGSNKLLFGQTNPNDEKQRIEDFKNLQGITDDQAELQLPEWLGGGRPLDFFGVDLKGNDIATYLADMAKTDDKGRPGTNVAESIKYLQTLTRGGVTDFRIDKLSPDQLKAFRTGARNMQAAQERTYNSKGGQSGSIFEQQAATQNMMNEHNKGVVATQKMDQGTRQQRINTILSGLPGEPAKASSKVPNKLLNDSIIDIGKTSNSTDPILNNLRDEPINEVSANSKIMVNPSTIPDVPAPRYPGDVVTDFIGDSASAAGNLYKKGVDDIISAPGNVAKVLGNIGAWGGAKLAQKHIKEDTIKGKNINTVLDAVNSGDISKLDSRHVRLAIENSDSESDKKTLEKVFNAVVKKEREGHKGFYPSVFN